MSQAKEVGFIDREGLKKIETKNKKANWSFISYIPCKVGTRRQNARKLAN